MSLNEKIECNDKSRYHTTPSTYQMVKNSYPSTYNFAVNTETIQRTTDRSSEVIETAVKNQKKITATRPTGRTEKYASLLLCEDKAETLIDHFISERLRARQSQKINQDFSVRSCQERLEGSNSLYMFSYTSFKLVLVRLRVQSEGFSIFNKNCKDKFLFQDFYGVLLGSSSTVALYKRDFQLEMPIIEDCFSIIGKKRTVDFYTPNSLLRYDLLVFFSWMITYNTQTTMIPMTKKYVTLFTVKAKIRADAEQKLITVSELFLLAMASYLKRINDPRALIIQKMIQKKFTPMGKFLRYFQFKLKGKQFLSSEDKRVNALMERRVFNLLKRRKIATDNTSGDLWTIKQYFKKKV